MKIGTRLDNILDLALSNDGDFITEHEVMDNVIFTDHTINIFSTNLRNSNDNVENAFINYYFSDIQLYNLMNAEKDQ